MAIYEHESNSRALAKRKHDESQLAQVHDKLALLQAEMEAIAKQRRLNSVNENQNQSNNEVDAMTDQMRSNVRISQPTFQL